MLLFRFIPTLSKTFKPLFVPLFAVALLASAVTAHAIKAPEFSLKSDRNQTVSLKSLKGKVVYVDFWASWCTPCKQSFPWMNEIHKRYSDKGLKVVAINLDNDRSQAKRFLDEVKADFTIAYDPAGTTAEKYDLQVMPSSYLIDRKGRLVHLHRGFKQGDTKKMEQKISEALKK